jgi:hypothetical protein
MHVGAGVPDEEAEVEELVLPDVAPEVDEVLPLVVEPVVLLLDALDALEAELALLLELAPLLDALDVPPVLLEDVLPLDELPISEFRPGRSMPQAAATKAENPKPKARSKERFEYT